MSVLKSCKNYKSISPFPKCAISKPLTCTLDVFNERDSVFFCLKSTEIIKGISSLHNIPQRTLVWSHFRSHAYFPPVDWLRWYLGNVIGFYFAWLRNYCLSLIIPSTTGLLAWMLITIANAVHHDEHIGVSSMSVFQIFYGLIVVIWALGCNKIWRRLQSQLSEDWLSPVFANAADISGWVNSHMEQLRPMFRGSPRMSPITGEVEIHFPASKRRILYLLSASGTLLCVFAALFVNVLLLNLEVGVIIFDELKTNVFLILAT